MFQRSFLHHHPILSFLLCPHLMNITPSPLASRELLLFICEDVWVLWSLPFSCVPTSLSYSSAPAALVALLYQFSLTSDLLLAFSTCTSWALTVLPSASFSAKPLIPVLLSPDIYTCIHSSQQLFYICSYCILIEGTCSLLTPSSQPFWPTSGHLCRMTTSLYLRTAPFNSKRKG